MLITLYHTRYSNKKPDGKVTDALGIGVAKEVVYVTCPFYRPHNLVDARRARALSSTNQISLPDAADYNKQQ